MTDNTRNQIIEAIDQSWWRLKRAFRKFGGVRYFKDADLERLEMDADVSGTNCVFNARVESSNPEARIKSIVDIYRQAGRPMTWWVGAGSKPGNLGEILENIGFDFSPLIGMALDLSSLPSQPDNASGLSVKTVETDSEFSAFCRIWTRAIGVPPAAISVMHDFYTAEGYGPDHPWTHFLGCFDNEPVATSSVYSNPGAALINFVGTEESFRGRGLGLAMTAAACTRAKSEGRTMAVLQATDDGAPVYRKLGFKDYLPMGFYKLDKPDNNS